MATGSDNKFPKVIMEEVATDGSATVTPAADHRALYLGEDGALHLKDSAAAVTDVSGATTDHNHTTGGGDGGDLDGARVGDFLEMTEVSAPSTPASGFARIYAKSDGRIYSKDDAGVEFGPFDAAGGGGTPLVGVQFKTNGSGAIGSVVMDSAPTNGNTVILACDFFGSAGATAVSSTNTTWTKVIGTTAGSGSQWEIWAGVVAGGAGGTTITITHAQSFLSVAALEIVQTLTPTAGATIDVASSATDTIHTMSGVTTGNVVIASSSNSNSALPSAFYKTGSNAQHWVGLLGGVVSIAACYASSATPSIGVRGSSAGRVQMVELS